LGFETLLDKKTVLKNITINIGTLEVLIDDIVTVELRHGIDDFGIFGHVAIKDTYDFNNSGLVDMNGDSLLQLSLTDFSGNKNKRTFRILKIEVEPTDDNRFKLYSFYIRDEISFILDNTYLSKSFNKTPVQALSDCMTHLGIDAIANSDLLSTNIIDTTTVDKFVIPQNMSVLSFFKNRLKEENVHIYQDRQSLNIKQIDLNNLVLNKNSQGQDILYSNNASNSQYLYLVHDYQQTKNDLTNVSSRTPVSRIFRFTQDKNILDVTKNHADVVGGLSLNTHQPKFPNMSEKYKTQIVKGTKLQDFDLFQSLIEVNTLDISVPGDVKNANAGTLINLDMKGNILNTDSMNKGDVNTGGKYLIKSVSDRIINDKLIHRYTIVRVDSRAPR